jgi:hypothetical protein
MHTAAPPTSIRSPAWSPTTWPLIVALWGTALFGALMLLVPGLAHQGFGLLMFGDASRILSFSPEALGYATLLTGVLGAVMVGWALGLLALLRWCWAGAPLACWRVTAVSLGSWFVVDTLFSLAVGGWQNAVLNLSFAVLFAAGLWMAYPHQTKVA